MCSHCLGASCDFFSGASGATRGKSRKETVAEDCTESSNVSAVAVQSPQPPHGKSYGARAGIGLRTVPMRGLCNATYEMSTGFRAYDFFQICQTSRETKS